MAINKNKNKGIQVGNFPACYGTPDIFLEDDPWPPQLIIPDETYTIEYIKNNKDAFQELEDLTVSIGETIEFDLVDLIIDDIFKEGKITEEE